MSILVNMTFVITFLHVYIETDTNFTNKVCLIKLVCRDVDLILEGSYILHVSRETLSGGGNGTFHFP